MDFIFILIALWVLVETALFLLKTGSAASFEYDADMQLFNDLDYDGAESYNSSELSIFDYNYEQYEDDSGVVGSSKPSKKMDKKGRQILLAKRLARRNRDRQIILKYFQNKKSDTKSESEGEEGYDSDYETSQAELVELFIKMTEYIRWHKIVSIYDLSYKFQLTDKKAHDHLEKLQIIGLLQGVCDDLGKFIYVAQTELTAVSKFIEEQNLYDWPQIGFI